MIKYNLQKSITFISYSTEGVRKIDKTTSLHENNKYKPSTNINMLVEMEWNMKVVKIIDERAL